jgi:hypothetical protein
MGELLGVDFVAVLSFRLKVCCRRLSTSHLPNPSHVVANGGLWHPPILLSLLSTTDHRLTHHLTHTWGEVGLWALL